MESETSEKAAQTKKIYRSSKNKIIGGVCGGVAEYLDIDPTIIRLCWGAMAILSIGLGVILYIIAVLIIPMNPIYK